MAERGMFRPDRNFGRTVHDLSIHWNPNETVAVMIDREVSEATGTEATVLSTIETNKTKV